MENNRIKLPIYKRLFDIVFSFFVLLLLFPLLLILSILILFIQGYPIFFSQIRPGLCGKPFALYKFRTMLDRRDRNGNQLPDKARITALGGFLRRTSLDELPEFINVLKGDMSIVGPRPLLMQYLKRYSPEQARRHHVLPGITGWAQVNGRNALTWEDKFKLDVWYVDHWSFGLDIHIILMTIWKVISGEGISQSGHATMPEFMGNSSKKANQKKKN